MADKIIRAFEPEDLSKIEYHDGQSHVPELLKQMKHASVFIKENSPICVTFVVDGVIMGCFGVTGDRYAWAVFSKHSGKHMFFIAKKAKFLLDQVGTVWTNNLASDIQGHKWCELIGFENKGVAKVYGETVDYIKYLRTKHGN